VRGACAHYAAIVSTEPGAGPDRRSDHRPDTGRGLVLVVEDEPAIADVLRLNLRAAGYGVEVVGDGATALDAARDLRPSAIVLDIGLPVLDGIEVCRRLRGRGDWTPCSS
jgi:CheY-like chemotaxis protein